MSGFTLRPRLAKAEKIFAAWIVSNDARVAEIVASVGFDAAFFDLQHGEASFSEARDAIAATRRAGKPAGIRVGLEAFGDAARLLDLGAEMAIMPMVNSVQDALRLVDTLKYPPIGGRSYGPVRGADLLGLPLEVYRAGANENVVILAMIETRAAVEALDDILDVPGLDGVFVGPSDLSISLSYGKRLDPRMPDVVEVMKRVLASARARRKVTAIFCAGGEVAARNAAMGFDILAVGSDLGFLADGAAAALAAARGGAKKAGARY
jgi:4-hydroxy-2-oxoheptanedioate aldolase